MQHHAAPTRFTRGRERAVWAAVTVLLLLFGGGAAYAAVNPSTVDCDAATSTPNPDGTVTIPLHCRVATPPAPSGSPTASPSPTPTVSPSPSPSPAPGVCPVAGRNTPGAADPWGGCWPGPGNTGVPAGTTLTAYTGPCTITAAGTVIEAKTVTCPTLDIRATGVVIRNSKLQGTDVTNLGVGSGSSFTITDSTITNGARDQCMCLGTHDFTALRVEIVGGNRSAYCEARCTITDSWLHGQQLQGAQHGSGLRQEQYTTAIHSTLSCDWAHPDDSTSMGCSADLGGYPDFAAITHNTYRRNLFIAASRDPNNVNPSGPGATTAFCAVGGVASGKPFSSDPANATYIVFTENVWQRGITGRCGDYGPISGFGSGRTGNVWSGNVWDDGAPVAAA